MIYLYFKIEDTLMFPDAKNHPIVFEEVYINGNKKEIL